ncbi:porin [Vibrio sp. WXL103]|uniref:porin n=1 Tax=Vibrio sp. WXL103 TaxID=3450710 RepID=UPI003EC6E558
MNKSVVAKAVLLGLIASPSFATTIYDNDGTELAVGGRVEFRGDFIGSDGVKNDGTMEDLSRARLNVEGSSEVTSDVTAFAFWEAEFTSEDSEQIDNRYIFAGLDTQVGAFSVGRQDTAAVIVSDMTDTTEFSGVQQAITASSDQQDAVFAYALELDTFSVTASFQASSDDGQDRYSVAGIYMTPFGLDLGLAYSAGDVTPDGETKDESEDQVLAGLSYTFGDLYFAGSYSTGKVEGDDFDAYELVTIYDLTEKFTLAALYTYQEVDSTDDVEGFELVGYFDINSSAQGYASYYANQISGQEDTLRLGLKYSF